MPPDSQDTAQWDQFVARVPGGDILQTTAWGETKSGLGFSVGRVVLSHEGELAGGGQIIVKRISALGGVGYIAHGPLLAPQHSNQAVPLMDEIEKWSRANRVRHLIVQPGEYSKEVEVTLESRGYFGNAPAVAPTVTLRIDLRQGLDKILRRMSPSRRREIKIAEHSDVSVRLGCETDIDVFCSMHEATARRQNFVPLSRAYLRRQWESLHSRGWLQLFVASHQGTPTAGIWVTAFGESVTYRLAGWTGGLSELRPNVACHWSAIQWAKNLGYRFYDLGGFDRRYAQMLVSNQPVPGDLLQSPSEFKHRFGGDIVFLPQPRQFTFNPFARTVTRSLFSQLAGRSVLRRFVDRFRNG